MDFFLLKKILEQEPPYRLKQAKKAVFEDLIEEWSEATILPLFLRQTLEEKCSLKIQAKTSFSQDKATVKALIVLKDGLKIESVLMKHKDNRQTLCVSSQVGCSLACRFCATGKMGFKRNLEVGEIIDQILFFSRELKKEGKKITNIVFMGMGEPFLNYDNVLEAIKILNDNEGFNLGARHFSISTVGLPKEIERLAEEKLQINLAISLHAANDELRNKIIPINKEYPLREVFRAVDNYIKKTKRRVMFEYLMIEGVNDSEESAAELVNLLKKRPLYFVNLISYNPTGEFMPSSPSVIKKFKEILEKEGIAVTQRYRFGRKIKAACGQLAAGEK